MHIVGAENFLLRTAGSEGKKLFESDGFGLMIANNIIMILDSVGCFETASDVCY